MSAELFLSAADAMPMYRQIVDQITARVIAGDWPPGSALPSIRELAAANGVSVITVKRAYLELEHAGVIHTRHGKGSFVAESTDPSRARLHAELLRQIEALCVTADRLGLTAQELQELIDLRRSEGASP